MSAPVEFRSLPESVKHFVASAHRDAGADATQFVLRQSGNGKLITVAGIDEAPTTPRVKQDTLIREREKEFARFRDQSQRFGVKLKPRAESIDYHIPLRLGPFVVGELICTFASQDNGQFDWIKLRQVLEYWSSFTALVGGQPSWRAQFEPRNDPGIPGICMWDEKLAWCPPEDFPQPIRAKLTDADSAAGTVGFAE